jgi:serine/threonine protein kinase
LGGTEYYSAPECTKGGAPITTKADIWSAGAVLYSITYGKVPFNRSSEPPSDSSRTRSNLVHEVIDRCLQRDLHRRASHRWLAHHPFSSGPAIA